MSKLARFLKTFLADCDAVVTAEFLVGLPLIFVAFVTAYEMGRALWAFNVMTSDVEAGLRYLTHTQATSTDITAATNLVKTGATASGYSNRPPWNWAVGSPTINVTTSSPAAGYNQGMTVVTMSAAVPITLPFLDFINKARFTNDTILTYTLRVSDQAACITGVSTPCGAN